MDIIVRNLGQQAYQASWLAMQQMTETRMADTLDELWIVEHPPVYTLGLNGKVEHILNPGDIPVVQSDRGGQVTYHGPGQLVIYVLVDLKRKALGVRALVTALEQSMIHVLRQYGLMAAARKDAPGVYIDAMKIASVGLRIRRHCSYHGLSLNVDMDLSPFQGINPCGHAGLTITQLSELEGPKRPLEVSIPLIHALVQQLNYNAILPSP